MNRALVQDQRGAAAVEFAIVMIPFLLLLMGGMDLGY
ncbi:MULTISPECIES: TadE/TadG family type IV pilus assembly protein [unclassified Sphingomonas]|nr:MULTISPECIES: TadE/TadG family type IV pilus assembly protein [unclassified Sphingomonas]